MLLLTLGLLLYCDIMNCEATFKEPLRPDHEAARDCIFKDNVTDITWSRIPSQTTPITPQTSLLRTPIGRETYLQSPKRQALNEPYFSEKIPQTNREISHRKASNILLNSNSSRPHYQLHQETTVFGISQRRNPGSKAKASLLYNPVSQLRGAASHRIKRSQTVGWQETFATKKRLIPNLLLSDGIHIDNTHTDDDDDSEETFPQMNPDERVLRMREITEKLWFLDQTAVTTVFSPTTKATTTRQILKHKNVVHSYYEMIETLQEGYMMVFLIELTRLIATKDGKAVRDVVKHTEHIIHNLYISKQLLWLGKPFINITRKVARLLKESETDIIQNHAAKLYQMLSQRHQMLSVEVNTILEYADTLYDDKEGRLLFDALRQFAVYPNIRLTGYWVCHSLINNFLRPYRRLQETQQRKALMDSVNLVLQSQKKTELRYADVKHRVGTLDDTKSPPLTEAVTESYTTQLLRPRKRKQHHRSHKREREMKRHGVHRRRRKHGLGKYGITKDPVKKTKKLRTF